jgi:hypothetical protein
MHGLVLEGRVSSDDLIQFGLIQFTVDVVGSHHSLPPRLRICGSSLDRCTAAYARTDAPKPSRGGARRPRAPIPKGMSVEAMATKTEASGDVLQFDRSQSFSQFTVVVVGGGEGCHGTLPFG